ncbi:MAG: aminotransferase class V-fold PLP-dependent enzyme [Tissierellaceae bacterium]|nr:aminotransferase class V-fold PLP-dependent enzyme [Tissierellaceae bacterium]
MYSFTNDYSEGAHPKVLDLMMEANLEQNSGYGNDIHSDRAKEYIKKLIQNNDANIHFIPGGTITNLLVVSSFLRPHQAVIAADTGHITGHETGAIEATGHKVISVPGKDGKLTPEGIKLCLKQNSEEFTPKPKMVYISNSTELGTIYTKSELTAIHELCKENGLILFLDGARLGSALASKNNDLTLKDIAELTDVFYIGGTKNGALFGEALVIIREDLKEDFRQLLKQRGAMLAKGFVLGMQFEALFKDNLFFELGEYANNMAEQIIEVLKKHNISFLAEPCSNQVFPILNNDVIKELSKNFSFNIQEEIDDRHSAIRFVTSWATTQESVDALVEFFNKNA